MVSQTWWDCVLKIPKERTCQNGRIVVPLMQPHAETIIDRY